MASKTESRGLLKVAIHPSGWKSAVAVTSMRTRWRTGGGGAAAGGGEEEEELRSSPASETLRLRVRRGERWNGVTPGSTSGGAGAAAAAAGAADAVAVAVEAPCCCPSFSSCASFFFRGARHSRPGDRSQLADARLAGVVGGRVFPLGGFGARAGEPLAERRRRRRRGGETLWRRRCRCCAACDARARRFLRRQGHRFAR